MIGVKKIDIFYPSNFFDLNRINFEECQIICDNPKKKMTIFFENFKWIEAAGGIVFSDQAYLFIKRNGLWDIPKGKMESNESPEITAIREIQEECGLKGELTIQKKLVETFHTYEFKGKSVLKKTYWFLLEYIGDKTSQPQLEEGITEVNWLKKEEFHLVRENTYASINDVLSMII